MKNTITVILCVLASLCVLPYAQVAQAQELYPFQSPAYTKFIGYDSNGVSYICYAKSSVGFNSSSPSRNTLISISAASNANPVVFTSTGHGLIVGSQAAVTISGGTGNWTAVNTTTGRTVVATVIDADTFSIPVNSTSLSTVTGTLKFKTTAPRTTVAEWAVTKYLYDDSGRLSSQLWLGGHNLALDQKCSDATSATVNAQ